MWFNCKEWLLQGTIDSEDEKLANDLGSPGAHIRPNGQLVIESKESMAKRGLASPDDGDALALTFAQPVSPIVREIKDPDDEDERYGPRWSDTPYYGRWGWMR